jgi:hypothetical protein
MAQRILYCPAGSADADYNWEDKRRFMGVVIGTADAVDASAPSSEILVSRVDGRAKIAAFFDWVMEAGWLAAVVVVPLVFSPNMVMIFGVPKAAALWSLASGLYPRPQPRRRRPRISSRD